jgi:hypothetical protein
VTVTLTLDVQRLVTSVDDLLGQRSMEAIATLARQAGCQAQIDAVVDVAIGVLAEVDGFLAGLREPLAQLGALQGLLELVQSLATGLGRLVNAVDDELAAVGLGNVDVAHSPLATAVHLGARIAGTGAAVLAEVPAVEQVDALRAEIARVGARLAGYKRVARGAG